MKIEEIRKLQIQHDELMSEINRNALFVISKHRTLQVGFGNIILRGDTDSVTAERNYCFVHEISFSDEQAQKLRDVLCALYGPPKE